MTLAGVHKGDIVRAAESYGVVTDKRRGAVQVAWLGRTNGGERWIKASEITAHWRRSKVA